jgi:hypothetical protein
MEHTKIEPRHVAEPQTLPQVVMHRLLVRILEVSTMELIVGVLHLAVTTAAVLGLIGAGGGGGH